MKSGNGGAHEIVEGASVFSNELALWRMHMVGGRTSGSS